MALRPCLRAELVAAFLLSLALLVTLCGGLGASRRAELGLTSASVPSQPWLKQKSSPFPLNVFLFFRWDFHVAIPALRNTEQMAEILESYRSRWPGRLKRLNRDACRNCLFLVSLKGPLKCTSNLSFEPVFFFNPFSCPRSFFQTVLLTPSLHFFFN